MSEPDTGRPSHTNRLAHETSPYLLQHRHNPVDWYPWSEEALRRARDEGKPILLSIGYSACHWCHVMAHESFEDEKTAALMNEHFVNVKVDREERPDLDQIYQTALQMISRRGGGWPLTMFLNAEGRPFFGGTYFPDDERYGMPSFRRVLQSVAQYYRENQDEVTENCGRIVAAFGQMDGVTTSGDLSHEAVTRAVDAIVPHVDRVHGGLGSAPKFPQTGVFTLFLRQFAATGESRYLETVTDTLRHMAHGGIYDHLGGGFARYSTDERWLVPHFEKMLYDNGLLMQLYLEAYQASGDRFFADVVVDCLRYLEREMYQEGGGFYATEDADSEGEEGRYYVWQQAEIETVLGDDAAPFCSYYGVRPGGNWEGKNILHVAEPLDQVAQQHGHTIESLVALLADCRARLFAVRAQRVPPGKDTKAITAWNGMAISACARAFAILGHEAARRMAEESAEFLWTTLRRDGRLLRTYKDGQAKLDAYLDDYAYLALGLVDLFEATGRTVHLRRAAELGGQIVDHFAVGPEGGFYFTADDHETLIHRAESTHDQSIPAGSAVAVEALLRIATFTDEARLRDAAQATLRHLAGAADENPLAYASLLAVADRAVDGAVEVCLVGDPDDPTRDDWRRRLFQLHLPRKAVCVLPPEGDPGVLGTIAEGREAEDGRLTGYVCRHATCTPPITDWPTLERTLAE
ncbi:MAG: thioredoxin domain-containing protein [Nitrospirota bacterium]|jgi:uncharacterized protein YyaL (SSP411 family)